MVQWSMQSAGLRIPSISAIIAEKKIRINAGADSVRTGLRGRALIRLCACAVTRSMIVHYTTKFLRKPGLPGDSYQILMIRMHARAAHGRSGMFLAHQRSTHPCTAWMRGRLARMQ
jgi:hypothetical protein